LKSITINVVDIDGLGFLTPENCAFKRRNFKANVKRAQNLKNFARIAEL
jgi:hypothetical protein